MWITNTLTGCIVGLSVAIRLNYVSVQALKLSYYAIQKRHEYYRLFTCLICWDHLSMGVLFQTYVFWQFSSSFESSVYNKKPMQYLFGIFVLAVSILSQGFMFKEARYPLLADIFTNGLSTWWSRVARDSPVSFYGLTLKAGASLEFLQD
mmetsp:Transcript_8597/g.14631  ORF Transcript_8597/g.14631 Transcript_8597/m.14631 type:complete len:150 (-) Transcript_8597:216-665(-)